MIAFATFRYTPLDFVATIYNKRWVSNLDRCRIIGMDTVDSWMRPGMELHFPACFPLAGWSW